MNSIWRILNERNSIPRKLFCYFIRPPMLNPFTPNSLVLQYSGLFWTILPLVGRYPISYHRLANLKFVKWSHSLVIVSSIEASYACPAHSITAKVWCVLPIWLCGWICGYHVVLTVVLTAWSSWIHVLARVCWWSHNDAENAPRLVGFTQHPLPTFNSG